MKNDLPPYILGAFRVLCSSVIAVGAWTALVVQAASASEQGNWPTMTVGSTSKTAAAVAFDGVVEPVRQAVLAAQIAGAVVQLQVKAGDKVRTGQVLAKVEARAAEQGAAASAAQVEAAVVAASVAEKELSRQRQLFQKQYISQAALDRALGQWEATQAQLRAAQAQARVAQTQMGYFILRAPFDGVVSEVAVTLGDMVMPGKPLLTMHDPSQLRVKAAVAQNLLSAVKVNLQNLSYEIPEQPPQAPASVELLPTVDAMTHTAQVRLLLPAQALHSALPGMFARVWLPGQAVPGALTRIYLPEAVVLRRGELLAVYVLDSQGQPRMRQVRLGSTAGGLVEVLSGLSEGDRVVLEPRRVGAR